MSKTAQIGALIGAALLSFTALRPVYAAEFASLMERPVTSGELRLTEPIVEGAKEERPTFERRRTEVLAKISGMMAHVTVEQVFENTAQGIAQAVYLFPLSHHAAVNGFEIMIGERTIRGQVRELEAAKRAFQEAKRSGRTAAILESQKPNIFQQALANIPPGAPVRVRLRYVEGLDYDEGYYRFHFPLIVAPRYQETNHSASAAGGGLPNVSITVHLDAGVPIAQVHSPSHSGLVRAQTVSETQRLITLNSSAKRDDRDFVLRYKTGAEQTYVGFLAHRDDSQGYFNLIIQPKLKYQVEDVAAREVILLVDRSCSMRGQPLAQARRVARAVIDGLSERDSLSVISFSDRADILGKRPRAVTPQYRAEAKHFVGGLQAGGGTRMLDGVAKALRRAAAEERIRMVYILTDGAVGNDDQILNAVRKHASHNRLFVVGLGLAPNRYLLDRLAEEGRGFSSYLGPQDTSSAPIRDLVKRTRYPYLTDVEIDWGELEVQQHLPTRVPDVYAQRPLILTGRYRKPGRAVIKLRGRAQGRDVEIPLTVELPEQAEHPGLALLWAKRKLDRLMTMDRNKASVRAKIAALGLRHQIITPYTAFLAIDEQDRPYGQELFSALDSEVAVPDAPPPPTTRSVDRPRRRRRRLFSGGGGGDLDPITVTTIIGTLPLAWRLRRRKSKT